MDKILTAAFLLFLSSSSYPQTYSKGFPIDFWVAKANARINMKNLENKTYHKLMPDIDSTNIKVVYQKNAKTLLCFVSIFHNHGHRYNVQAFSAKDLKAENEMLLPDLLWEGVLNNSTKTYVGLNEVRQVIVAFPNEKQEKSAKENVVKWEYYRYTLSYDSAGNNIPNIKGILIWGKPVIVDTVSQ